ncbi:hypothetical protein C1645_781207 [Glomus cerebriforme]|uniref:Uncharacterized protein n=1 Tax=Glomus cerebriforme TaxID=658196 RepID=A0A397SHL4_9GLOM|nr:hypothetical protein C1645_781207 [Glomus cerebriforme]
MCLTFSLSNWTLIKVKLDILVYFIAYITPIKFKTWFVNFIIKVNTVIYILYYIHVGLIINIRKFFNVKICVNL